MTWEGWGVVLNGVATVDGCNDSQDVWDETGCFPLTVLDVLTDTPTGLDLPDLRTEDVSYYQRDGVKHFSDWYTPRFVTITGTLGPVACTCDAEEEDNCHCLTVRQQLSELVQAWKRQCCDTELVIYPPCPTSDDNLERIYTGPFGIVGRPTEFKYREIRGQQAYDFVALFRAVDQRMYVLDECGTPGYSSCVDIDPGTQLMSVCFAEGTGDYTGEQVICFGGGGFCFSTPVTSDDSVPATELEVGGTEKVNPEIVFYPPFQNPYIENQTTGEFVWLEQTAGTDGLPVTINTEDGTAFDSEGTSLTHLLRGSLFLSMYPGNYEWRYLTAGDFEDPGYATVCWRDTVVNA